MPAPPWGENTTPLQLLLSLQSCGISAFTYVFANRRGAASSFTCLETNVWTPVVPKTSIFSCFARVVEVASPQRCAIVAQCCSIVSWWRTHWFSITRQKFFEKWGVICVKVAKEELLQFSQGVCVGVVSFIYCRGIFCDLWCNREPEEGKKSNTNSNDCCIEWDSKLLDLWGLLLVPAWQMSY